MPAEAMAATGVSYHAPCRTCRILGASRSLPAFGGHLWSTANDMVKTATPKRLGRSTKLSDAAIKVESKSMNRKLTAAREAKQDEFYTRYVDIQKEVEAYLEFDPDTFRGKVVYCNCDDPFESNFFKYFVANFNRLGLKKLVTTSYDGSPIAGTQLTFGEYEEDNGTRQKPKAIAVEIARQPSRLLDAWCA